MKHDTQAMIDALLSSNDPELRSFLERRDWTALVRGGTWQENRLGPDKATLRLSLPGDHEAMLTDDRMQVPGPTSSYVMLGFYDNANEGEEIAVFEHPPE